MSRSITCADRSGFLFAHACDRIATGQCSRCAKPICVEHTRMTDAGATCVSCVRDDWDRERDHTSDDRDSASSGGSSTAREPGFIPAGGQFGGAGADTEWPEGAAPKEARADDPYFYAGPAAYDADDYRAFEPAAAGDDTDADSLESDTGAS